MQLTNRRFFNHRDCEIDLKKHTKNVFSIIATVGHLKKHEKNKKKRIFFRSVDLLVASGRRNGALARVSARVGASRRVPELNQTALRKPIYTRARIKDWR